MNTQTQRSLSVLRAILYFFSRGEGGVSVVKLELQSKVLAVEEPSCLLEGFLMKCFVFTVEWYIPARICSAAASPWLHGDLGLQLFFRSRQHLAALRAEVPSRGGRVRKDLIRKIRKERNRNDSKH